MFLQHLCTPALVYLVLGCIGSLKALSVSKKLSNKLIAFLSSLAAVFLMTYLFDYICKTYGVTNSWYALAFIYLFPIVIMFIILFSHLFFKK